MGARQSTYLVDVQEPQPQHHQPGAQADAAAAGARPAGGRAAAHRPPPLNLSAPPAPTASRRRVPICSALDTVDFASTHPHSPAPSPAATGLVDVWIIAGQSNAVGDNAADGTPIPAAAQPLPGLVLSYDSTGTWRDAAPNIHAGIHGYTREPSCGPALAFGRTLVALGLSSRVGLVPTAGGATNLFHDWRPAGGGDLYGAMIARTKAALAAPLPGGGSARLRGMIWVQGEADAEEKLGPAPSEAYGSNFAAFVHAVRRDLASYHAQLPVLLGVMPLRKRECFPYLASVRRAQLGTAMPGLLRIDLAGYEFFEEYGGFHVHLTKDGATALGAAMAHTYYSAVVRAGLPRRPGDAVAAATVTTFALGQGALSGGSAAAALTVTKSSGGGATAAAAATAPAAAPSPEAEAAAAEPPPTQAGSEVERATAAAAAAAAVAGEGAVGPSEEGEAAGRWGGSGVGAEPLASGGRGGETEVEGVSGADGSGGAGSLAEAAGAASDPTVAVAAAGVESLGGVSVAAGIAEAGPAEGESAPPGIDSAT